MSDWIEQNGKKYYEAGYLTMANNTAKRRGEKIKELQSQLETVKNTVSKWVDGDLNEAAAQWEIACKLEML